jgi:hypothetical protein
MWYSHCVFALPAPVVLLAQYVLLLEDDLPTRVLLLEVDSPARLGRVLLLGVAAA